VETTSGGSDRLHPLCHTDLVSDCGVTQSTRTDLTGDHFTGVQSHAQPQVDTVAGFGLSGQPGRLLLDARCRKTSADSVVLQGRPGTQHRHDPVAGELVHRAAVAVHHRCSPLDQFGHDLAKPLRPDGRGDVHRMHNIGEQHRDLLVLRVDIAIVDWRATPMTEPGVL
jgi:hypothetical protein